jgi:putative ABC transport system substrate-binding protein
VHHRQRILDFATAQGVPTIAGWKDFVRQGGLMSYFTNWDDLRGRTAVYVDKILKGAKPADLVVLK